MPRFHFNVRDAHDFKDVEDIELLDLRAARKEAVQLSEAMISEATALCNDWRLEVTDDAGLILLLLTFSIVRSSAVPTLPRP